MQPLTDGVKDLFVSLEISRARTARQWGRSPVEISALVFIGFNDGVTPHAIADRLSLTTGSVTALLDRLQVAGLIERRANPDDRRSLLIAATDEGQDIAQQFVRTLDRIVEAVTSDLTAADVEVTRRIVSSLTVAVDAHVGNLRANGPRRAAGVVEAVAS